METGRKLPCSFKQLRLESLFFLQAQNTNSSCSVVREERLQIISFCLLICSQLRHLIVAVNIFLENTAAQGRVERKKSRFFPFIQEVINVGFD
jgi:hypothetical protein